MSTAELSNYFFFARKRIYTEKRFMIIVEKIRNLILFTFSKTSLGAILFYLSQDKGNEQRFYYQGRLLTENTC